MICELSRDTAGKKWDRKELGFAVRGTCITSVWYPGARGPVHHAYFENQDGRLCEYRHEERDEISALPKFDAPPPVSLSAMAWFDGEASVQINYVSAAGELWELSWFQYQGWIQPRRMKSPAGVPLRCSGQIASLQMER